MPIHPKVLEAFAKKGLTMGETKGGKEIQLPDSEIQMIAGIGQGFQNTNHTSWIWMINKIKEEGETPEESVIACKRIHEKKSGKEYALFTYQISGRHYDGTTLNERWREYGLYHLPIWKRTFDGRRNKWVESDEVVGGTLVYEYEFKGDKMQIESPVTGKWIPITDLIREDTQYHVIKNDGAKLRVSKEDWFSVQSRDELIKKYDTPATNRALEDLTKAIAQAQQVVGKQ